MPRKILVREDFRRDGLSINFLVDADLMALVAKAFPGSRINVGYPAVCKKESEACERILFELQKENIEAALVGHADKCHLDIIGRLIVPFKNASANFWIPISNEFISRTLGIDCKKLIDRSTKLVEYWKETFPNHHIDIALADCTANENGIEERIAFFSKALHDAGVRSVIVCDSVGRGEPSYLHRLFGKIRERDQQEIEFHPHNDNGYAFKNVAVAIEYGVTTIGTALMGAGERLTMLDPRDLILRGHRIVHCLESLKRFESEYSSRFGNMQKTMKRILAQKTVVTGTQYRLIGREKNVRLLFGVSSDRYILAKLSGLNAKHISAEMLESLKNSLYEKRKLFFTSRELKMMDLGVFRNARQ